MHLGRPAKALVLFSLIAIASTFGIYRLAATSTAGSVAFVVTDVSPTATATPSFPLNAPNHVAIADLGNGCPDLVVPNKNNDTIAILMNQKVGGVCSSQYLQRSIQLAPGAEPQQVALAEFQNSPTCLANGNANVGIAVIEQGSGKVEVFTGNGDGTFAITPVSVNVCGMQTSATCRPASIAAGDLNGDGIPDLAIGYAINMGGAVGFLTGSLTPATCAYSLSAPTLKDTSPATGSVLGIVIAPLQASSPCTTGMGTCDDVAATDFNNGVVDVFQNATMTPLSLSMDAAVAFATGSQPEGLVARDLNGDGKVDLAVANFHSNNASVLLNNTSGSTISFAPAVNYATGLGPISVAAADLDSDGFTDLAVANKTDNTISVLRGAGDGTFSAFSNSPIAELMTDIGPASIAAGGLNADTLVDLVVANSGSDTLTTMLNSQVAVAAASPTPSGSGNPQPIAPNSSPQTLLTFNLNNSNAAAIQIDSIALNFTASAGNLAQNVAGSGVALAEASPMATPIATTDFSGCAGPGQNCAANFTTTGLTLGPGTTTTFAVALTLSNSAPPALGTLMTASIAPAGIGLHSPSAALVNGVTLTNHMIVAAVSAGTGPANFVTNEGQGAHNVPGLQFTLEAPTGIDVNVSSLTFQVNGTGNVPADISQFGIVDDLNGDGFVEASDSPVATPTAAATSSVTLPTNISLTGGTSKTFLLSYNFNSQKGVAGATYQAQLTGGTATVSGSGSPVVIQGLPTGSNNTKTISLTNGSLAVETAANNPGNSGATPGSSNVSMLLLQAFASTVENVQLNSIVITDSGSGNPQSDVAAIKVYLDDGDGVFNAGDSLLGQGTFNGSTATISLSGNPPVAHSGQPLFPAGHLRFQQ